MRLLENKRHLYIVCRFGESGIVRGEVSVVKQLRFESSYDSLRLAIIPIPRWKYTAIHPQMF